jgi:hypothetical protein
MEAGAPVSLPVGGTSTPGQLVYGIIILAILFLVMYILEILVGSGIDAANRFQTLMDTTLDSSSQTYVIHQNPLTHKDARPLGLSVNERTGVEFSYSFFIFVDSETFAAGTDKLYHVLHKGYQVPWPLMGPAVFIRGNENTMRVYMNTFANPIAMAEVKNIPIQKWFHVVLNCYKGGLDVFVNGNLATRVPFTATVPYQNFQDVYLFSKIKKVVSTQTPVLGGSTMEFDGSFKGKLSNLVYARYALSMGEIQKLLRAGPSMKIAPKVLDEPPYLADDWWGNQS